MDKIKELYEKLGQLDTAARKIIDAADAKAEGKGQATLTAEESAKVDEIYADYDAIKAEADALEKAQAQRKRAEDHTEYMKTSVGRRADPLQPTPDPVGAHEPTEQALGMEYRGERIELVPGSDAHLRAQPKYRKAFQAYLGQGLVQAGLQTGVDPQGGYLVPMQTSMELIKFLDDEVFMRQLATVLPPLTVGGSLGIPTYDTDPGDADWTAEVPASDISEDTAMRFGKRELTPHLLTKLIKVSMKLLRAAALSPEAIVRQRLGYKFAYTEENAFLTGTGAQRPLGVFVASDDGIPTARDTTAAATTSFTADNLIETAYALKGQYFDRSTWILHRDTLARIRKLKDGEGQYLWARGIAGGQPSTILDRPFVMSENAPNTFTTGLYVAILGDFKTGYWIIDSLQMEIQRLGELFSLKNQIGLLGRKETDGMPVLGEAFSRLVLA